jgi:hypothetical protein
MKNNIILIVAAVSAFSIHANAQKWTETKSGNVSIVTNKSGQALGYSASSGVKILTVDGFAFKISTRTANWISMKTGGCRGTSAQKILLLK